MKATRFVIAPDATQAMAWFGHTSYSEADLRKIKREKPHTKQWPIWEVQSEAREVK